MTTQNASQNLTADELDTVVDVLTVERDSSDDDDQRDRLTVILNKLHSTPDRTTERYSVLNADDAVSAAAGFTVEAIMDEEIGGIIAYVASSEAYLLVERLNS